MIGDDLAPPEFTRLPTPTDAPLLKKLQTELPAFVNAPIAQSAYALGEDLEEPHWMVGTIAIDIQQEYSRSTVDSAAAESYDDFISQYESETPSQIVFDQHQEFVAANSEWSAVMKKRSAFEQTTVPIFEDVLLLQYFEEVLLGTVAFAPIGFGSTATDIARGYANWQRATLLVTLLSGQRLWVDSPRVVAMSEQQSATRGQKDGILSDEEREVLSGSKGDNSTREALCEVLRERLRTALIDLEALYMWLPDDDLQAVFNPSERRETSAVRAASQEALSLLFIGMDMNGDVIEERITESLLTLESAKVSRSEHILS
ncbi:hypothetical protein ACFQRB_16710 [Halobaculum litoreum]|uniref:Uncharacterized protein n=1 Tax=Halobaculum litoreum TaxID=3031998 RepID=A0ABD5XZV1_9EURY